MYRYDTRFTPPAPVLPVFISSPSNPLPLQAIVLVDSGTEITVIPRTVARNLDLKPAYIVRANVFGAPPQETTVYSALVALERGERQIVSVLVWDEDFALLGRDIINRRRLTLDGPGLTLTIAS